MSKFNCAACDPSVVESTFRCTIHRCRCRLCLTTEERRSNGSDERRDENHETHAQGA